MRRRWKTRAASWSALSENTMARNAFDILEVATEAIEQRLRQAEVLSR